eukprot:scaffold110533_cov61-Phaeocystis_antarctica.AAC.2
MGPLPNSEKVQNVFCLKDAKAYNKLQLDRRPGTRVEAVLLGVHASKNRSHLRSSTLACADFLTGSPNSCARSSSSAICFCFYAAVGRCEAASVSATLAASSALLASALVGHHEHLPRCTFGCYTFLLSTGVADLEDVTQHVTPNHT